MQAAVSVLGRLPSRPEISRGDLTDAQLPGAQLGRATLSGAALYRVNLSGAALGEANLTDAWLDGANLATAKNLTQQQLDPAQGNEDTKLPAGLQRPAHWPAGPA